ncbi:unnamed protein product [Caenorhabditis angaria]|uniref:Integrase catalytic domain-containing protein n=1 Tax=Caenorhabditis angaria TaxID=860376 RepID=A0A9P1IM61_9PELO|nr:unnamed protein product [Caenorhabditis angaria]
MKHDAAERAIIRYHQKKEEIVENGKEGLVKKDDIVYKKTRLENALNGKNIQMLIAMKGNSHISKAIIEHYHEKYGHCGVNATMGQVQEMFWMTTLRRTVKDKLKKCATCRKLNSLPYEYPQAPHLPRDRVTETSRAFENCATDFCGPFLTRNDNNRMKKVFICLFTCSTSRAVHLETTGSLSTQELLLALTRFVSRRGVPKIMRSDNGSSFVLAAEILNHNVPTKENLQKLQNEAEKIGIDWRFNTAAAPWQGGNFERLVALVKKGLNTCIGKNIIGREVFETTVTRIEKIINERPITVASNETNSNSWDQIIRPIHLICPKWEMKELNIQTDSQEYDEYTSWIKSSRLLQSAPSKLKLPRLQRPGAPSKDFFVRQGYKPNAKEKENVNQKEKEVLTSQNINHKTKAFIICTKYGALLIDKELDPQSEYTVCAENTCVKMKSDHKTELALPAKITTHEHLITWRKKQIKKNEHREESFKYTTINKTCPANEFCEKIDCWLCKEKWSNPQCHPILTCLLVTILLIISSDDGIGLNFVSKQFLRFEDSLAMVKIEENDIAVKCNEKEECTYNEVCKCTNGEEEVFCSCKEKDFIGMLNSYDSQLPIINEKWTIEAVAGAPTIVTKRGKIHLQVIMEELLENRIMFENENCSIIDYTELQGCFGCEKGAVASLTCESENDSHAFLECENFETTLTCKNGGEHNLIRRHFSKSKISETCQVSCGDFRISVPFEGTLHYIPPEENEKENESNKGKDNFEPHIPKIPSPAWWTTIDIIFENLPKIIGMLILGIIGIIIIAKSVTCLLKLI